MSYVDEFIHRLNDTAPHIKAILRKISHIDIETQKLQMVLEADREEFLKALQKWQKNNNHDQKASRKALEKDYRSIATRDKQLLNLAKQKVQLAEELYNDVHDPTEKLDKELHTRGQKVGNKYLAMVPLKVHHKKGKKKGKVSKDEWQNDPNEPKYCYCGKASFGEMVMCENRYCTKEWFHRECIEEKKLPEKWFCRECRGGK